MAEPDYLEGDCEEMIKPKKLLNPVKGSRNHQDLHRELMMNQKRWGDCGQHWGNTTHTSPLLLPLCFSCFYCIFFPSCLIPRSLSYSEGNCKHVSIHQWRINTSWASIDWPTKGLSLCYGRHKPWPWLRMDEIQDNEGGYEQFITLTFSSDFWLCDLSEVYDHLLFLLIIQCFLGVR